MRARRGRRTPGGPPDGGGKAGRTSRRLSLYGVALDGARGLELFPETLCSSRSLGRREVRMVRRSGGLMPVVLVRLTGTMRRAR